MYNQQLCALYLVCSKKSTTNCLPPEKIVLSSRREYTIGLLIWQRNTRLTQKNAVGGTISVIKLPTNWCMHNGARHLARKELAKLFPEVLLCKPNFVHFFKLLECIFMKDMVCQKHHRLLP